MLHMPESACCCLSRKYGFATFRHPLEGRTAYGVGMGAFFTPIPTFHLKREKSEVPRFAG